jgi:hypothetical protein
VDISDRGLPPFRRHEVEARETRDENRGKIGIARLKCDGAGAIRDLVLLARMDARLVAGIRSRKGVW